MGCGALADSSGVSNSTRASANSLSALRVRTPLSRKQAIAFAQAVNLTIRDVGEARAMPAKKESVLNPNEQRQLAQCEHRVSEPHAPLADISSPRFVRGSRPDLEYLSSTVAVLRSARVAEDQVRSAYSLRARNCLTSILPPLYPKAQLSILPLPVHAPDATASGGQRLAAIVTSRSGVATTVYEDAMAFVVGPVEVTLQTSSIVKPVPAALENHLLSLLLHRAERYPL